MTITAVLKWENQDSTQDLNSKFEALFTKGFLTGGTISTVSGMLSVDVQPFTCMSNDGMLVTSDNSVRLTIPIDQTNIIALHAKHLIGDDPILEVVAIESSLFYLMSDISEYVIFGAVTTVSPATEVASTDISYALRQMQDKRSRSSFRGHVYDPLELPTDPNFIYPGDFYIVAPGGGSPSNIYAWDGYNWYNITATSVIVTDLAQHRANLFTNEIHLSDDQADAALGSSGLPDISNRYVTESDTRLPTQLENDALVGTNGTPSSTNKYITEEYPLAASTLLDFLAPPGGSLLIASTQGPVFVGKDTIGSANKYFSILAYSSDEGYLNSSDLPVKVNGAYKDIFLSVPLNPSTDGAVDSYGFFTGDLYLSVDNVIDTSCRLLYGKSSYLNALNRNFSIFATPGIEVIAGSLLYAIANIKGRAFGDPVPTAEQNINLRTDIDNTASYIGSVLETNVVAANEDFVRLSTDPILGPFFEKNIGISDILTFDNTGLVSFTYTASTGIVQYISPVNLSGVRVGDLFRDGGSVYYLITSVNDGLDQLVIVDLDTQLYPQTITTSVGSHIDGSIKINNNPRDLLLSEMKFSYGSEFVKIDRLVRKSDEYSLPDGQIAYSIVRHDNRFDPRVVFYGGWENYETTTMEKYVRNFTGNGKFIVTGFFTELVLILRRKSNSPALDVSIDGQTATTISTSALGSINASVASSSGAKYHQVVLASSLPSDRPNTISASITAATLGSLDIYGIMLVRSNSASLALLESGRAFDAARIISRDTIDTGVTLVGLSTGVRGGRLVYALAENSYNIAIGSLTDLDNGTTPSGKATDDLVTITSGAGKLNNYKVNDIILVYSTTSAVMRRISNITTPDITLDSTTSFSDTAVTLKHICSTDSNIPLASEESFLATYILPDDFIDYSSTDFQILTSMNRYVVGKDGLTTISGVNLSVVDSGIIGVKKAVEASFSASSEIRFTVTATRLDLLMVNASAATANISIDGSPYYSYSFTGGMAQKRTIFSNSRYQTHEIVIIPTSGAIQIAEIFLFAPKKPEFTGYPNEVADLMQPARYIPSMSILTAYPNVFPLGGIFKESLHYISYIDGSGTGSDWAVSEDYSKAPYYGRYVAANREDASIEFYFLGTAFELQYIMGPDHGIFDITVDATALELTGTTIVGDYTGNQVDAYAAVYGRKNIGAYGFSYGYHKVIAKIQTPRAKNGFSSGYYMAFTGYYECNDNGYMSIGINKENVYSGVIDLRNFIPLDMTPLDITTQITSTLDRSGKISISSGVDTVVVNFTEPFVDTTYTINVSLMNVVDATPVFQPILITAQSTSSFTVKWNVATPTANYVLCYHARTSE